MFVSALSYTLQPYRLLVEAQYHVKHDLSPQSLGRQRLWPPRSVWLLIVWLGSALLPAFPPAHAQERPPTPDMAEKLRALEQLVAEDPRAAFARASIWRRQGVTFPEALLKKAVETALRPDALWEQTEAAIASYDLYYDRPWVNQVLTPYALANTEALLRNTEQFVNANREWTKRALEIAGLQAPAFMLSELARCAAIDPVWAQRLGTALAERAPAAVLPHAKTLIGINPAWAQTLVREAVLLYPYDAVRSVPTYLAAPWGPALFAEAVFRDPRWVVGLSSSGATRDRAVIQALRDVANPSLKMLAQIAKTEHADEVKVRMAIFAPDLVASTIPLDEAVRLSNDTQAYFRKLVTMQVEGRAGLESALEQALSDEALDLVQELNSLHEEPPPVRFRAVENWGARELYMLLVYGETDIFTSSYRGVFDRLIAKMQRENMTGDRLLAEVKQARFRVFMKSAAVFHRLDPFLDTIPSPVARWTLLTRCVSELEQASDLVAQSMTVAELLWAPLDLRTLNLIRDTLKSEYARVARERNTAAMGLYGVLAAQMAQRTEPGLVDAALTQIAKPYLAALPNLTALPVERLFTNGVSVQRYFFYNDDDGKQSFQSFLAQYRQAKDWRIDDYSTFIQISSTGPGRIVVLYANHPTSDEDGIRAIDELFRTQRIAPNVIVHRGHSPYVETTLEHIPPTVGLVFLGNCGGYLLLEAVLTKAPQTHMITTKGIGSLTINDPLLKALNEYMRRDNALTWPAFWRQAETALGRNPRFGDYVSPDKSSGVVFLKAYRTATGDRRTTLPPMAGLLRNSRTRVTR